MGLLSGKSRFEGRLALVCFCGILCFAYNKSCGTLRLLPICSSVFSVDQTFFSGVLKKFFLLQNICFTVLDQILSEAGLCL